MLSDNTLGPLIFNYIPIVYTNDHIEQLEFIDFFSGRIFSEIVTHLVDIESIKNDVFLTLSADGADPIKSTQYSFWPTILTILNLPPENRFKLKNLYPVMIIPGPKNPKDISFFKPLLDELEILSNGIEVELWNGCAVHVKVHFVLVTSDMMGRAKLSSTKGPNGKSACIFCNVKGIFEVQRNHIYFPHQLQENSIHFPSDQLHQPQQLTLLDFKNLPIRSIMNCLPRPEFFQAYNDCVNTFIER